MTQRNELMTPAAPVEQLSAAYLEYHGLLPLGPNEIGYRVATWLDQPDVQALDDLRLLLGREPELVQLPRRPMSGRPSTGCTEPIRSRRRG